MLAVRCHAADGDEAAGGDVLDAALQIKEALAVGVGLDELIVVWLGEEDDLIADMEHKGVKELLRLLAGEGALRDLLFCQRAEEGVDQARAVRPVDTVRDQQIVIEKQRLDSLPQGAGGVLYDPVATVRPFQELCLAIRISGLGGLLPASLGIASAHENHAVADLDVGPIEKLAAHVLRRGVLLDSLQLFLRDAPAFSKADHHRPLIAGAEVAGKAAADAPTRGAARGHEGLREDAEGSGSDVVVLPKVRSLEDPGPILIRDPDTAGDLPGGPEALVRIPKAVPDPGHRRLLDVKMHGAAMRPAVAEEDIVVVDVDLPGGKPSVQEARPLQNGVLVFVGLVILSDDAVALKIQAQVLVDAFPFFLECRDAR